MVLEAVSARFTALPAEIVTRVQGVENLAALHRLHRHAITCSTLEAFREALETPTL